MGEPVGPRRLGSTADVAPAERVDHWRALFGAVWGSVRIEPVDDSAFFGRLASRRLGPLTINDIEFGGQSFHRPQRLVRRLDLPFYSLAFPVAGWAECQIGDARLRLAPGAAYLINNNTAGRLSVPGTYRTRNIQVPVAEIEARMGRVERLRRIDGGSGALFFGVLRAVVDSLVASDAALRLDEERFLTDKVMGLLGFLLAGDVGESLETLAVEAHRARVLAHLEANYWREDLSPGEVARACGISASYLHRLFRGGPSVMESLRGLRLRKAKAMLEASGPRRLPLGEIACHCGFRSHAEFSRSFVRAFGTPPSRYERGRRQG